MILFNDCRLCKECSKVRSGAMCSDVQTKVSEDVIFGVFLQIWMIWFCCYCWLVERVFLKMIHLQDKILKQRQRMNHLSFATRVRLGFLRPILSEHSNISGQFHPLQFVIVFFVQSVYYRCIYNTPFFVFCWTPRQTPEKALKHHRFTYFSRWVVAIRHGRLEKCSSEAGT